MFINLPGIFLFIFALFCWQQSKQGGVVRDVEATPAAYTQQTTSLNNNIQYRSRNPTTKPTASTIAALHRHRRNRQRERQRQQQNAAAEAAAALAATATATRTTTTTRATPSTRMSNMQTAFVYKAEVPQQPELNNRVKLADVSGHRTSTVALKQQTNDEWPQNSLNILPAVTVVLNGNEPQLTDALGHKIPKTQKPLQVASPIDLLNPDRYEFYTFDENGELVKRLMTMQEIQSIVANGDGEGPTIIHKGPTTADENPEENIQNIVNNVQNVLNHEVKANRNTSAENILPVLDTPDVSSTWSIILPAILGNTGDEILPQQPPQQIVMIPDSDLIESSTALPMTASTIRRRTKPNQKRKPGQKRKTTTTTTTTTANPTTITSDAVPPTATTTTTTTTAGTAEITPQIVQEELDPYESVYTGIEQYHEVAVNMENFESFVNFQKIPLYQKVPEEMTTGNSSNMEGEIQEKPIPQMGTTELIAGPTEPAASVTPLTRFTKPLRKTTTTTTTTTTSKPVMQLKDTSTTGGVSITIMESKRRRKPTKRPLITSTASTTTNVTKSEATNIEDSPLVAIVKTTPNITEFTTASNESSTETYTTYTTPPPLSTNNPFTTASSIDLIAQEDNAHLNVAHNEFQQLEFGNKLSSAGDRVSSSTEETNIKFSSSSSDTTTADNTITIFTTNAPSSEDMQITTVADIADTEATAAAAAATATAAAAATAAATAEVTTLQFEQKESTTMSATPNFSAFKEDVYPQPTYNFNNEDSDEYNNYKEAALPMPIAQKPSIDDLDEEMDNPAIDQEQDAQVVKEEEATEAAEEEEEEEEEEVIDINAIKSFDKILQTLTQAANNGSDGANNYMEPTLNRAENQQTSSSDDMWQKIASSTYDFPINNQINQTANQANQHLTEEPELMSTTALNPDENSTILVKENNSEPTILKDFSKAEEDILASKDQTITATTIKDLTNYSEILQTEQPTSAQTTENHLRNPDSQTDLQTELPVIYSTNSIVENDATTLRPAVLQQVEELITQQMHQSIPQQTLIQFDPKPYVNMDALLQQKPVNMSVYQQQAATVASSLLNQPSNSTTLSPEPTWSTEENRKGIETLITEVIQQMTLEDNNNNDTDEIPTTQEIDAEANNQQTIITQPPNSGDMITDNDSDQDSKTVTNTSFSYEEKDELSTTTEITKTKLDISLQEENLNTTDPLLFEQEGSTKIYENLLTTVKDHHQSSSQANFTLHQLEILEGSSELVTTEMPLQSTETYQIVSNYETEEEVIAEPTQQHESQYQTEDPDRAALFESDNPHDRTTQLIDLKEPTTAEATMLTEEENLPTSTLGRGEEDTTVNLVQDFNETIIGNKENETNDFPSTLESSNETVDSHEIVTTQHSLNELITMGVNESNTLVWDSDTTEVMSSEETMKETTEEFDSVMPTTEINKTQQLEETIQNIVLNSQHLADVEESYIKLGETTVGSEDLLSSVTTPTNRITTGQTNYEIRDEEDDEDQLTESNKTPNLTQSSHFHATKPTTFPTLSPAFPTKTTNNPAVPVKITTTKTTTTTTPKSTTRRMMTLKPVSYFNKQPSHNLQQQPLEPMFFKPTPAHNLTQQKLPQSVAVVSTTTRSKPRPAQLNNLMAASNQTTRPPIKLEPSPSNSKGLEASIANLDEDVLAFTDLCNELAFSYWKAITSEKISSARSLLISPFALTSMLSMLFLGARGRTSGEMNDILRLDDMVTFNPHVVFKNITDSVERATDTGIATAAFVRELYSDRNNGKILQFFKEKIQQFYSGHVEEVNFHVVNDIIRRRTNLLMKRHTRGKVLEYLRTNSVWINGPLATVSANLFQTDCSKGSTHDRDGELFFQVHPSIRQRRLIPIPAVLYRNGFTAGYEPNLDAIVVGFGRIEDTVSLLYVMPGHQSSLTSSDNLQRLERQLMDTAISQKAWKNLLTSLMDRPGMEVQLPRFSHRSFINATMGLQKLGLKGLFTADNADLAGLTGSSNHDIYLADMIQINTFSTCGEERIADHHHVEMYPAPPLRKRNKNVNSREDDQLDSSEAITDFGSLVHDDETALGRGFYDDLLDPKYLELPLPLRPRQARVPDAPRLRFDKPFLYFVRHNPTGMILYMGRFNPRLLP